MKDGDYHACEACARMFYTRNGLAVHLRKTECGRKS